MSHTHATPTALPFQTQNSHRIFGLFLLPNIRAVALCQQSPASYINVRKTKGLLSGNASTGDKLDPTQMGQTQDRTGDVSVINESDAL